MIGIERRNENEEEGKRRTVKKGRKWKGNDTKEYT